MAARLSLARNILASNVGRLPFPYKLTFCVTYWCNYRCKTCNIWLRRPENELTLEEVQRFFKRSNRFNWIDFTGGEVWLRKDFVELVEAAIAECRNLALIHFPTNGFQTERIVAGVERILRARPPKLIITVSVDGNEAVNDDVRGVPGGWRRQIDTYKALHALSGVQVVLGMTLSALNADQYERAFAAAKAECPWLEPNDFHMNVAHESGHYYQNAGSAPLEGAREQILEQVRRYAAQRGRALTPVGFLERAYLERVEGYLRSGLTPMRCHALRSSCFVDSWGDVYPCGMYDRRLAGLRDHDYDLQRIWELPQTRQTQSEIWNYDCPQCWTPCEAYQSILGNLLQPGSKRKLPATPVSPTD